MLLKGGGVLKGVAINVQELGGVTVLRNVFK